MATIREMAIQYGLLNPVIHYDADGNTYDDHDKPSNDFEAGANAVLEEIESCYDKNDSLCVIAHKIQSKIIELKGE